MTDNREAKIGFDDNDSLAYIEFPSGERIRGMWNIQITGDVMVDGNLVRKVVVVESSAGNLLDMSEFYNHD